MNPWLHQRLQGEKSHRQSQSLWRRPRAIPAGCIDLGSNDYLGLSRHPQVLAAACEAVARCGSGARSSRLLGGDHDEVRALEHDLARWKSGGDLKGRALVFSSGYAANIGTVTALAQKGDWLLCDKRNHASLIDAARLAESNGARVRYYGSIEKLRSLLERGREERGEAGAWIVSDTVYSMDGDVADLHALLDLARCFDAGLILDDAHGSGVLGAHGRGALEACGVEEWNDVAVVTIGTLSKALASQGGFVFARAEVIEWLENSARSFIYSTGIAPSACGAARGALQVLEAEPERLEYLRKISALFVREMRVLGFKCEDHGTPIVPIIAGSVERAVTWSESLDEAGVWCPAVRPPTVAPNTSRLRASLRADLSQEELERVLQAFKRLRSE